MIIPSLSGIRFTTDEDTADIAMRYAAAFAGTYKGKIVVGRDARPSGKALAKTVVKTLTDCGCTVTDIGIVPTPTLTMALIKLKAKGGVMITASHNPIEWNGLKLFDATGDYLNHVLRA
jgi:phosphomannomutase